MALATTPTKKSVSDFINSIEDQAKKEDAKQLLNILRDITGKKPIVWGDNFIIGFGKYKYKRKGSKEELEWFNVGFAPRKTNLTIYLTCYLTEEPLVEQLGKCTWGKGCLYIKRLADVDMNVLKKLITKYKDSSWY